MINFATVGTNFVVDWFIKATSKCDSLKYKGTYSRNINKAKEFGEKYGSTLFFDDLDELAKCDSIDAVYIASPTSFHFEQALKMIENKKHVFDEYWHSLKLALLTGAIFSMAFSTALKPSS